MTVTFDNFFFGTVINNFFLNQIHFSHYSNDGFL